MKITHKHIVPAIATVGVIFMIYSVAASDSALPPSQPIAAPAKSQFAEVVSGAGLVEASTQNILIGTQLPGVVTGVHIKVGDKIRAGDPLFSIDDRAHRADLLVREANLNVAEQNLARLSAWPRKEDVAAAKAKVAESQALANDAKAQLVRVEQVSDPRAVAKEEVQRRRFQADAARARLEQAKASLALMEAGPWKEDLAVAKDQVKTARAQVAAVQTDIERLVVRAPVAGEILQINIRPGEYLANSGTSSAPVVMGNTQLLHVRVDVDESDAWRVNPKASASGSLRGNSNIKTDLRFVRVEPFIVPKRSLTGGSNERVDTRVLQVLYSFDRGNLPIYVGQQMDVFIDASKTAAPVPAAAKASKQGASS